MGKNSLEWENKKGNLDTIYYICWLELGLKIIQHKKLTIELAKILEYIPKGLEWPLWNYLLEVTKEGKMIEDK